MLVKSQFRGFSIIWKLHLLSMQPDMTNIPKCKISHNISNQFSDKISPKHKKMTAIVSILNWKHFWSGDVCLGSFCRHTKHQFSYMLVSIVYWMLNAFIWRKNLRLLGNIEKIVGPGIHYSLTAITFRGSTLKKWFCGPRQQTILEGETMFSVVEVTCCGFARAKICILYAHLTFAIARLVAKIVVTCLDRTYIYLRSLPMARCACSVLENWTTYCWDINNS